MATYPSESKAEKAHQIWTAMSPMERLGVMDRIPYQKSLVKRFRACLALIEKEVLA